MNPPNGNGQAVPVVPPGQVPTIFAVADVVGPDGKHLVALQVSTPVGTAVYFLDPDCAIQTGQNLRQYGRAAKTGLTLPGPGGML